MRDFQHSDEGRQPEPWVGLSGSKCVGPTRRIHAWGCCLQLYALICLQGFGLRFDAVIFSGCPTLPGSGEGWAFRPSCMGRNEQGSNSGFKGVGV
jgi:hypothetical protein